MGWHPHDWDYGQSRSSEEKSQGNKGRPGENHGWKDQELKGEKPGPDGEGAGQILQNKNNLSGEEVASREIGVSR